MLGRIGSRRLDEKAIAPPSRFTVPDESGAAWCKLVLSGQQGRSKPNTAGRSPFHANGSFEKSKDGVILGSRLVGQEGTGRSGSMAVLGDDKDRPVRASMRLITPPTQVAPTSAQSASAWSDGSSPIEGRLKNYNQNSLAGFCPQTC